MAARSFGQRGLVSPPPPPAFSARRAPTPQGGEVVAAERATGPLDAFDTGKNLVDALPLLTFAMILFLFGVYAVEVKAAFDAGKSGEPGVRSLIAYGAASYDLVFKSGEVWRPFLVPLLHANFSHLVGNCVALAFVGMRLEPMIGRAWFALIFAIGALGGAAGSLIANPHAMVTVGASGAITGLIGALFVVSFHHRAEIEEQRAMRRTAVRFGIPALAPLALGHFSSSGGMQVDYFAHLGGALLGGAVAWLLCEFWREHSPRPGFTRQAAIASLVALAGSAIGCAFAIYGYAAEAGKAVQFIPSSEIPADLQVSERRSNELLARYPKDPRSHIIRAVFLAGGNKAAPMEDELRIALALAEAEPVDVLARDSARTMLALVLAEEGRHGAAKAMAADLCRSKDDPKKRQILEKARLCD